MSVTRHLMDPIDFNSRKSQWGPSTVPTYIFFCVQQKKEIHTGLKQLESE